MLALAVEGFLVDRLSVYSYAGVSSGLSFLPSALSVLFIECAIIVGVGLLIARGIARVLLKAYHVRTDDPSTTSRHFGAETKNCYLLI